MPPAPALPKQPRARRPRQGDARAQEENAAASLGHRGHPQHGDEGAQAEDHEDEAVVGTGGGGAEELRRQGRVDGEVAAVPVDR